MSDSSAHDPRSPHAWWRRALLASATGFLFSLLLAVAMAIGLLLDIPPMKTVQRAGIDFSMRLFVSYSDRLDPTLHDRSGAKVSPGFVFFDVDRRACEAFSGTKGPDCQVEKPVPVALVTDFVRAAGQGGVKIVVIDVAPPSDAAERSALREALVADTGPWIIAPLYGRPAGTADPLMISGDPKREILPERSGGRLRLASVATISDAQAGDGVVRRFPMVSRLVDPDGRVRWIPSAPYLAAALAREDTASATDCAFYGRNCRAGAGPPLGGFDPGRLDPARTPTPVNRIFFSLPSLAEGEFQDKLAWRYHDVYRRRVASNYLRGGRFDLEGMLTGKIVVLGSSMAAARDLHPTPIGTLSGAEIVINAARAFAEFSPLIEEDEAAFGRRLTARAQDLLTQGAGIMRGAILLTPFWLAIFWILAQARGRRRAVRLAARLAAALLFATGMVALVLVELHNSARSLHDSLTLGRPVDVLTPLIGLGLEAYAEVAVLVTRNLEHAILLAAAALKPGPAMERGRTWLARRAGEIRTGLGRIAVRSIAAASEAVRTGWERLRRGAGEADGESGTDGAEEQSDASGA
jgi:hypothetical protein